MTFALQPLPLRATQLPRPAYSAPPCNARQLVAQPPGCAPFLQAKVPVPCKPSEPKATRGSQQTRKIRPFVFTHMHIGARKTKFDPFLFSQRYKTLLPQLTCFDIDTKPPGVGVPPSCKENWAVCPISSCDLAAKSATQLFSFHASAHSFCDLWRQSENQLLCFHTRAHDFVEYVGVCEKRK
jgi:hypothetical protein